MVDLLPETMRFVSVGEDGRLELEFVFEVTSGLTRFTLPVSVSGLTSIDEALAEATEKVRSLGLALARAARSASWADAENDPASIAARRAQPAAPPFSLERANGAMALVVAETAAAPSQCCDAIFDVA
jgi:hypothetical protein